MVIVEGPAMGQTFVEHTALSSSSDARPVEKAQK
jgi:hypothetical protein